MNLTQIAKKHCDQISKELVSIIKNDFKKLRDENIEYDQVFRAISILADRTSQITNAILLSLKEDNLYSSNILLRSQLEHANKVSYLIEKALIDKNDEVGKDYFLFCDFAEEIQYQHALNYNSKIIRNEEIDEKAYNDLIRRKPEFQKYSNSEILKKTKQFSFNNIYKFLSENFQNSIGSDIVNEDLKKGFEGILYNSALYSNLSSFVHGGPYADNQYLLFGLDMTSKDLEYKNIIQYLFINHFFVNIAVIGFFDKLSGQYTKNITEIVISTSAFLDIIENNR